MLLLAEAALILSLTLASSSSATLLDEVRAARKCHVQEHDVSITECNYDLGDLRFAIVAIGKPHATLTVFKVDSDAEHAISFTETHGCLIVENGMRRLRARGMEYVFISLWTGGIYTNWQECGATRLRAREPTR